MSLIMNRVPIRNVHVDERLETVRDRYDISPFDVEVLSSVPTVTTQRVRVVAIELENGEVLEIRTRNGRDGMFLDINAQPETIKMLVDQLYGVVKRGL